MREAACTLQTGKSPGVDNVPAELLKYGRQETIIHNNKYLPEDVEYKTIADILDSVLDNRPTAYSKERKFITVRTPELLDLSVIQAK